MIPAVIVPVYGRWDLTARMLGTVNECVERGLLVDNRRDAPLDLSMPPNFRIARPPFESFGWGGSLDLGITQTPDAPWWVWVTNDVMLGPHTLKVLYDVMEDAGDRPLVMTHRWAVGALNRAVVQRVGLFDTWSYHPIYFEDTDYAYRCHLAGIEVRIDPLGVTEGADGFEHSVTTQTDPELASANNRTWELNRAAYVRKWGGAPGEERYSSPWGMDLPLWAVRPALDARVARRWP